MDKIGRKNNMSHPDSIILTGKEGSEVEVVDSGCDDVDTCWRKVSQDLRPTQQDSSIASGAGQGDKVCKSGDLRLLNKLESHHDSTSTYAEEATLTCQVECVNFDTGAVVMHNQTPLVDGELIAGGINDPRKVSCGVPLSQFGHGSFAELNDQLVSHIASPSILKFPNTYRMVEERSSGVESCNSGSDESEVSDSDSEMSDIGLHDPKDERFVKMLTRYYEYMNIRDIDTDNSDSDSDLTNVTPLSSGASSPMPSYYSDSDDHEETGFAEKSLESHRLLRPVTFVRKLRPVNFYDTKTVKQNAIGKAISKTESDDKTLIETTSSISGRKRSTMFNPFALVTKKRRIENPCEPISNVARFLIHPLQGDDTLKSHQEERTARRLQRRLRRKDRIHSILRRQISKAFK